jgi:hypothetical protein
VTTTDVAGDEGQVEVPRTLAAATSREWLDAALAPLARPAHLESVDVEGEIHGVATKAIVHLTYDRETPSELPTSVCVKAGYEPHNLHILRTGVYLREARFYEELQPAIAVSTPTIHHAAYDSESLQGVIVMENLNDRGVAFGDAELGFTVDQAAAVLSELAKVHAWSWHGARASRLDWVPALLSSLANPDQIFTPERLHELLEGSRADGLPDDVRSGQRLHDALQALADRNERSAACFLHGDPHVRNIYFDAGGQPGLYDWQTIQRGRWSLDVAYFLGVSLRAEDRQASLAELLAHYCSELSARGITPPSVDEAWQAYRESVVYGFYLWVMTREIVQPLTAITAFVTRLGRAVADADAYEALGV